jgi:hypothetical protein
MDILALHGLHETDAHCPGKTRLLGNASRPARRYHQDARHPQAFGPRSHVGLSSERGLNSWRNSDLQGT